MKVRELVGFKSLRALNAFHTLMLGLKMLPMHIAEPYEEFYQKLEEMPEADQRAMISKAALFVNLEEPEVEAIVCFCEDANGVPYNPASLKKLPAEKIHEMIVEVGLQICKIKIDMISEKEKKKLENFSVDIRSVFLKNPEIGLDEALNIAFYKAAKNVISYF